LLRSSLAFQFGLPQSFSALVRNPASLGLIRQNKNRSQFQKSLRARSTTRSHRQLGQCTVKTGQNPYRKAAHKSVGCRQAGQKQRNALRLFRVAGTSTSGLTRQPGKY